MWIKVALVAALVLGALGSWWLSRLWRRLVLAGRRRRGRQGELDAVTLLTEAGYEILEDQASRTLAVQIDGEPRPYAVRPDYVVQRGDRRYVAEVKTGVKAPDPLYTSTRRQLLEYAVCFQDHGLLLVDMQRRRVRTVHWEQLKMPAPQSPNTPVLWLVAGALGFGLALGILLASV